LVDKERPAVTHLQTALDEVDAQEGREFELSFSAGVAMFDPQETLTLDQLIVIVDERMEASKRAEQDDPGTPAAATA
jgi:GGDEF domain-containing protein